MVGAALLAAAAHVASCCAPPSNRTKTPLPLQWPIPTVPALQQQQCEDALLGAAPQVVGVVSHAPALLEALNRAAGAGGGLAGWLWGAPAMLVIMIGR